MENYRSISQIPKPNRTLVEIKTLFLNIVSLMKAYLDESGVKLIFDKSDERLQIFVDITLIENIFINIIKNAVEANSNQINISWSFVNDGTIVLVKDNGSGFSNETKERAFLPFYTTKIKGSGLGLSFVRNVMNIHNGTVNIEDILEGSSIELIFK